MYQNVIRKSTRVGRIRGQKYQSGQRKYQSGQGKYQSVDRRGMNRRVRRGILWYVPRNFLGGEFKSPAMGLTTHRSSTRPRVDRNPETDPSANRDTMSPMWRKEEEEEANGLDPLIPPVAFPVPGVCIMIPWTQSQILLLWKSHLITIAHF